MGGGMAVFKEDSPIKVKHLIAAGKSMGGRIAQMAAVGKTAGGRFDLSRLSCIRQ